MTQSSARATPLLLTVIGGVYVSQSVVTGVAMQGVPALLRAGGASLQQLSMVALLMLPWALKFLWAPWVERYRLPAAGAPRSRRLIVGGQSLLLLLFLGLAAWAPLASTSVASSLWLLLALLMLAALIAASTDIACDGFAVDQLPPGARGWANVMQVGGSYVGLVLGSGLFLLLGQRYGWSTAWLALAVLVAALTVPWLWVQERRHASGDVVSTPLAALPRPSLRQAWQRVPVRTGLLLTLLLALGPRLVLALIGPRLLDHGVALAQLGVLNGIGGVLAGICGAVLSGVLVRRYGAWCALRVALGVQVLGLLVLAGDFGSAAQLMGAALLFSLALSAAFVASYTLLMHCAAGSQAGVDFTLFQCADALMAVLLGMAGGWLAQHTGYAICFTLAASLTVAALAVTCLKWNLIINRSGELL